MAKTIREWLKGKDVLVTGGFGFIGKGVIEKLLRRTEVNSIYLIIRSKGKLNAYERWRKVSEDMAFDNLRVEKPNALERVIIVEGDMGAPGLGISNEDKETLVNNVSIVFHAAACVRFDDPLANAILVNIRGTKELADLAKSMKKLESFVYVSTTFCNCNINVDVIEEKIYKQNYNWKQLIKMAEINPSMLNTLENKILATHPNTYTMCKSVTEMLLEEHKNDLPIVIFRPSAVVGSLTDPEPGWVDNFNGPTGVFAAAGTGVLRVFRANPDSCLDYVPIDIVINGMIVTSWIASNKRSNGLEVFNCVYGDKVKVTFGELVGLGIELNSQLPMDNNIWYPFLYLPQNPLVYYFLFYLLQLLPGLFLDFLLLLFQKQPILTKLNIKIYLANAALLYFSTKLILFNGDKFKNAYGSIPKEEEEIFPLEPRKGLTARDGLISCRRGLKKFLMKEKDADLDRYKAKIKRLYYIHVTTKILFTIAATWYITRFLKSIIDMVF